MSQFDREIFERFTSKINKKSVSINECWVWNGAKGKGGYGNFWINGSWKNAHRISYQIFISDVPSGLWVLHHCDNKLCVNPYHLFAGTATDNMVDFYKKFERKHRFSDEQIMQIFSFYKDHNYSQEKIASLFGITQTTVGKILRGLLYRKAIIRNNLNCALRKHTHSL